MSSHESESSFFKDIEWSHSTDEILLNIIQKNNAQVENGELTKDNLINFEPFGDLSLASDPNGNLIKITYETQNGQRDKLIGYYSPVHGEYKIFPELISDEESILLKPELLKLRQDAIDNFDKLNTTSPNRVEFNHPLIREFHEISTIKLKEEDYFKLIAHNFNMNVASNIQSYFEVDEHSSMAIYTRQANINDKIVNDRIIGVNIYGPYREINGEKRRFYKAGLDLFEIEIPDEYIYKPINDILDADDAEIFVELAKRAIFLREVLPGFCSHNSGVLLKPREQVTDIFKDI